MKLTRRQLRRLISESLLLEKKKKQKYSEFTTAEVIDAVDRALAILDIKDETLKQFMIRVARTESGGDPSGKTNQILGHDPNPFQTDKVSVDDMRTNVNMKRWRAFFDDKKGDAPSNVTQPLADQNYESDVKGKKNIALAAVFATLYVIWKLKAWDPEKRKSFDFSSNLGKDKEAQANWWKKNYNTESGKGKVQDFIDKN